ncbi:MAG: hypothetical protein V1913_18590 [Fibrobacterota bacterium]
MSYKLVLLAIATSLYAQSEFVIPDEGVGTRGYAMGGAQVALASDFSASYWNPAALTNLRQHEFMFSFAYNSLTDASRYDGSAPLSANINSLGLQSIGYAHPFPTLQGSLVLALGYSRPTNISDVQQYNNPAGLYKAQGYLSRWNVAVAAMLLKSLSLGINGYINSGNDEVTFQYADGNQNISDVGSFFGLGFDLGLLLAITENLRAGVSATLYNSENSSRKAERFILDTLYSENATKTYVQNPVKIRAGLGYHSLPFSIGADILFTNWENSKYYIKDFQTPFHDPDLVNTIEYSLGAESILPMPSPNAPGIKLRAGVSHAGQPYASFRSPDGRNSVSGGVGMLFDRALLLDIAGRYSVNRFEFNDGFQTVDREVKTKTLLFSISYRY